MACLAADGLLGPGETWVQESIFGGRFTAEYSRLEKEKTEGENDDSVIATITGRAFICSEATLINQSHDPHGLAVQAKDQP